MKRLILLTALCVAGVASADRGGNDNSLHARLAGHNEVPVVATTASGELDIQVARDQQSFTYTLKYDGLQGQVRQAHIHIAQRNVNGAIVVWLCGTTANPGPAGTPVCPASGSVTGTVAAAQVQSGGAQQIAAGDLQEVIDQMRAGFAYANVHTDLSPGGEIRGQVGHGH